MRSIEKKDLNMRRSTKNCTRNSAKKTGLNGTNGSKHFMETNISTAEAENTIIDKGKMRVLFRAGWTTEMIAFEMRMKEADVDEALSYYDEYGNWKGE